MLVLLQSVGIDSFDPVFGTFRAIPKATDNVVTISLEDIVFEEEAGVSICCACAVGTLLVRVTAPNMWQGRACSVEVTLT